MDLKHMRCALKEAQKAMEKDEVPVGCVIVLDGVIIARAHNKKETNNNPLGHAEMIAIQKATKKLGDWRLKDCEMYVTLEPCLMCCGALIQSRIKKVYYGAKDEKGGGVESLAYTFEIQGLNHYVNYEGGIMEKECQNLLSNYFKSKR